MDVTCNRCGTVYEFDETVIASSGMTVKCTDCGHLFKVASPSDPAGPIEARTDPSARWQVRTTDGETRVLDSLADLTLLIERGELTPDAEISRTGNVWRQLGRIAELASLFDSAAAQTPRSALGGLAGRARAPEPRAPSRARRQTPLAPPRPLTFESMGREVGLLDAIERSSPRPPPVPPGAKSSIPPAGSASAPAPAKGGAASATEDKPAPRRPPTDPLASPSSIPPATPAPITTPIPSALQQDPRAEAIVAQPQELGFPAPRRRAPYFWLLVGLPLAIGAGIAWVLLVQPNRNPPAATTANPARDYIQRADEALASHQPRRLQVAISEYTKALAFHDDDPHILSSISRTYAVWAQLLRFRLEYVQASGKANEVQLANLRGEVARLSQEAKLHAERAARRNPGNEEAELALGDALRLMGNLVAARAEVDRARSHEGVPSAESLRVAALLAIDEAHGDHAAGRDLAERAVLQDGAMVRARLLLARCLLAAGEPGLAKMHVDAVRRVAPDLSAIEELEGRSELAQAGKPSDDKPRAGSPRPKPEEERLTAEDAAALAAQGETALERGRVGQAKALFERALAASPGLHRAHTGLGYVALERSQPRLAVQHFRKAKRRGHAEAFIGLGDAYRRLGRVEDALEAYEAYLVRFPNGDRRSIAKRQVELLTEQRRVAGGNLGDQP